MANPTWECCQCGGANIDFEIPCQECNAHEVCGNCVVRNPPNNSAAFHIYGRNFGIPSDSGIVWTCKKSSSTKSDLTDMSSLSSHFLDSTEIMQSEMSTRHHTNGPSELFGMVDDNPWVCCQCGAVNTFQDNCPICSHSRCGNCA
jgi:hypothetical protein